MPLNSGELQVLSNRMPLIIGCRDRKSRLPNSLGGNGYGLLHYVDHKRVRTRKRNIFADSHTYH